MRAFLKDSFEDGVIPMDHNEGLKPLPASKKVWVEHCAGHEAFEGVIFNSIFTRRLNAVAVNHNSKNRGVPKT